MSVDVSAESRAGWSPPGSALHPVRYPLSACSPPARLISEGRRVGGALGVRVQR